jgi:hypothetical protein
MDWNAMAVQVQDVCGTEWDLQDIISDLRLTLSVEETVNRIVDGRFLEGIRHMKRYNSNSTLPGSPLFDSPTEPSLEKSKQFDSFAIVIDSDSDEEFLPRMEKHSYLSQGMENISVTASDFQFSGTNSSLVNQTPKSVYDIDEAFSPIPFLEDAERPKPSRYIFQTLSETPIQEKPKLRMTPAVILSSDEEMGNELKSERMVRVSSNSMIPSVRLAEQKPIPQKVVIDNKAQQRY